jgi:hypothetical protein
MIEDEIHEVWAELKSIYDEIDELNEAARIKGIEVLGTDAATMASAR